MEGWTPAKREGKGAAPSSLFTAPSSFWHCGLALCSELIEVLRFQTGMSRKNRLLIHTGRFLACAPAAPPWSQRPFVQCFRAPPHHSASHRDAIPISSPPPPQKKQPYLLHEAAAAPARSAAAVCTAAIPLSLNHCSNKLPFLVFPFIHKGSHRQGRQVETTFLLEEVGSLLRND